MTPRRVDLLGTQLPASRHVTCLHLPQWRLFGKEGILFLLFRSTRWYIAAFTVLQMCHLLYKTLPIVPRSGKIIHAFITSRLDYCNSLYLGLPQSLIARSKTVDWGKKVGAHHICSCIPSLAPSTTKDPFQDLWYGSSPYTPLQTQAKRWSGLCSSCPALISYLLNVRRTALWSVWTVINVLL